MIFQPRLYKLGRPTDGYIRGRQITHLSKFTIGMKFIEINHQFKTENLGEIVEPDLETIKYGKWLNGPNTDESWSIRERDFKSNVQFFEAVRVPIENVYEEIKTFDAQEIVDVLDTVCNRELSLSRVEKKINFYRGYAFELLLEYIRNQN